MLKIRNKTIFKFYIYAIFKNKSTKLILSILLLVNLSLPILISLFSSGDIGYISWSYIYFWSLFSSIVIFNINAIYIIFGKSKNNNLDLKLFVTSIGKWNITKDKILGIFIFSSLIHTTLSLWFYIIISIFGVSQFYALTFLFSSLVMLIANCALIMIFATISIYFKSITSLIIMILISVIFIIGPISSKMNLTQAEFSFANQRNEKYLRIVETNTSSSSEDEVGVIYENRENNDIWMLDNYSKFDKYNPLKIFTGLSTGLNSLITSKKVSVDKINEIINNSKFSSYSLQVEKTKNNLLQKNIMALQAGQSNPYAMELQNLYRRIILELKQILKANNMINSEILSIKTKMQLNINWNNTFNNKELDLIKAIVGLKEINNNFLYWIYDSTKEFKFRIPRIYELIEEEVSMEMKELMYFIWNDEIAKNNISILKTLVSAKEIDKLIPNIYSYDRLEKAAEEDIYKLKNVFVNIEEENGKIESFKVLNENNIYEEITNDISLVLGKTITTISEWEKYIDNNSTINNLEDILSKLENNLNSKMKIFSFKNNVLNSYVINHILNVKTTNNNQLWFLGIAIFPITIFISYAISKNKITRKDVI